ncbi:MAG: ATP-dependent Clp protease adaptor ClpS [Meiothermus sp.]|nr:ATP-dependent Clp protease adaptor ClpS [Meiothermus sp.]
MGQGSTDTLSRTNTRIQKAPMYKVLLLNDDYTTWDFVVFVLMRFFGKSEAEAHQGTLEVHQKGIYVAGIYTFEIAETKANQVIRAAQEEGHPFQATVEPE